MSVKNQVNSMEYLYDFAADGGAIGSIALSSKNGRSLLPVGAIVSRVFAKVLTACTSGGLATVEWGPTADTDGYSGTPVAVAALTANALFNGGKTAALLFDTDHAIIYNGSAADFIFKINTAALTAGKIAFMVEYYLPAVEL